MSLVEDPSSYSTSTGLAAAGGVVPFTAVVGRGVFVVVGSVVGWSMFETLEVVVVGVIVVFGVVGVVVLIAEVDAVVVT